MNLRETFRDVQTEWREEPQYSGRIGSLNLLTINPAVLWVIPSDSFLLLSPVSYVFMSGSKTVVFEPMF
jgi:hypothetical protein